MHHYTFHLYALGGAPTLTPAMTKEQVLAAITPHVLGEGTLVGTFEHKEP